MINEYYPYLVVVVNFFDFFYNEKLKRKNVYSFVPRHSRLLYLISKEDYKLYKTYDKRDTYSFLTFEETEIQMHNKLNVIKLAHSNDIDNFHIKDGMKCISHIKKIDTNLKHWY